LYWYTDDKGLHVVTFEDGNGHFFSTSDITIL